MLIRWTVTSGAARKAATSASTSATAPGTSRRQRLATSRSARLPPGDSTTSTMSRPSGSASASEAWIVAGSTTSARASSRYSASLADPVGAAPAYEIRGCGLNPEEYAIGTRARNTARSKARLKSRWLVKRSRPRLAYLIRSRCTGGACCSGCSLGMTLTGAPSAFIATEG